MNSWMLWSLVAVSIPLAACGGDAGGDTTGGGGSGAGGNSSAPSSGSGSDIVPEAECNTRCMAKATSCGAPKAAAQDACETLCSDGVTVAQGECLETTSCNELEEAGSLAAACPRGGMNTTTSTVSTSSGGDCSPTPACSSDGEGITTCEMSSSGFPIETTVKCQSGTCKGGECGYCTERPQCAGEGIYLCECQDGTDFGVSVDYDCVSNRCQQTSNPDCSGCADHGGVKP